MADPVGQRPEDLDVGPAFDIEHIAPFAGSDVVLRAVVLERISDRGLRRDVVGAAGKEEGEVVVERLVQDYFRVGDENHLRLVLGG